MSSSNVEGDGESLRESYLATLIRIDLDQERIFETSDSNPSTAPWPFGSETLYAITAWNPRSDLLEDGANSLLNLRLHRDLVAEEYDFFHFRGQSLDGSWHEDGFAILGASLEKAVLLAQKYEQNAIFEIQDKSVRLIDCLEY